MRSRIITVQIDMATTQRPADICDRPSIESDAIACDVDAATLFATALARCNELATDMNLSSTTTENNHAIMFADRVRLDYALHVDDVVQRMSGCTCADLY